MPQRYISTFISDKLSVSIVEMSDNGSQRVFRVFFGNRQREVTLDSWQSPSASLCRDGVFIWAGTRAFRLRVDATDEQFAVDEPINAIYLLPEHILLVCELSVRLLANDFRELDRFDSSEVLLSPWWDGEVIYVSVWDSQPVSFVVKSGRLIQQI